MTTPDKPKELSPRDMAEATLKAHELALAKARNNCAELMATSGNRLSCSDENVPEILQHYASQAAFHLHMMKLQRELIAHYKADK